MIKTTTSIKVVFAFIFFLVSFSSQAQSSEVIVSVTWPNWSSENYLLIYDPGGTLIGQICDPANCYTGSGNTSYSTTLNLGCQPDGNNYFFFMWDAANDGWDGADNVTITSGGATVINQNGNSATNSGFGPTYFNVSGGGGGCGVAPEMDVQGNATSIASGDVTPATGDDTDFGSTIIGTPVSNTFTILNTGTSDLTLSGAPFVTVSGSTEFSVTAQPTSPVASSGSTTFTVRYAPTNIGTDTATISIANDDSDENPYTFDVQGNGLSATAEIDIQGNGISIADGDTTPSTTDDTDFGSGPLATPIIRTFTIENQGATNLTMTGGTPVTLSGSAEFTVTAQPSSPISSAGTTTFQITYTPASAGTVTATVSVANSDSDENPYTFDIQGTGTSSIYCEDFNSGAGGWTGIATTNGQWLHGTDFATGSSGDYIYSERTAGTRYNNNTYISVESPTIDLTGYENLKLTLDVFYDTSNDVDDGMRIRFSTDGGANYQNSYDGGTTFRNQTLGKENDGTNWYNETDADGFDNNERAWAGNSGGWITAEIDLESQGFDNQSNIRFLIEFASDAGTTDRGVAFDNFCIEGDPITAKSYIACGPAGIGNDLELWLRADAITGLNDGDSVDTWEDLAFGTALTNGTSSGTERPTYLNNATDNVNGNPVVRFDGNDAMYGKKGFYNHDIYVVIKPGSTISSTLGTQDVFCGDDYLETAASQDVTGISIGDTSARYGAFPDIVAYNQGAQGQYGNAIVSNSLTYDLPVIFNARINSSGDGMDLYLDGIDLSILGASLEANNSAPNTYRDIANTRWWLGRSEFFGGSFDGDMLEVIVFSDTKTAAEKALIESYLAVKYGINLGLYGIPALGIPHIPVPFYDSTGVALWDTTVNAGYTYNVSAIGRDDCTLLNQKESKSIDPAAVVRMGLGDIYGTNDLNPNSFDNNMDFLIWGSNNSSLVASATPLTVNLGPTTVTTITDISERIWKVTERATGDIGRVKVQVATSDLVNLPALAGNDAYVMIVADDDSFTTNLETVFLDTNGANQEAYYDFDGTRYFAFGVAHEVTADRHLTFDGTNDYTNVGDKIDLSGPFSVSSWVYSTGSNDTNDEKTIISKRGNSNDGYHFYLRDDNRVEMRFGNTASATITSNTALNDNQWRHVAFTFDGTNANLYIDGVLDNTEAMDAPAATAYSFAIGSRYVDKNDQRNFFDGSIDEIRIWNSALTVNQIRYIMNQEIEQDGGGNVDGEILPLATTKNDINGVAWTNLLAYFNMNSYLGTHLNDVSGNGNRGSLVVPDNFSIEDQTAPLPYVSTASGAWTTGSTWENGTDMYTPNATLTINGTPTEIEWNIVSVGHDVNATSDVTVLGLLSTANELSIQSDSSLIISHYLSLDGTIDLEGESQLIQTTDSDLAVSSGGNIERDQQGTADLFTYNYWSAPVGAISTTTNNTDFTLSNVLRDGTTASNPQAITYTNNASFTPTTNPVTLSNAWVYKFVDGTADDYNSWVYTGNTGNVSVGEGFTLKGTGTGGVADSQNYVFTGKPNNGDITLSISANNEYLIGNPYPSSIDSHEFIDDNLSITGALYLWQHWGGGNHNTADYQGGYAVITKAGSTPAASHPDVSQTGTGTITPGRYIPVAQGFYVVGSATGGTITFENDQRFFVNEGATSTFLRNETVARSNNGRPKEETDLRPKIRLGFTSPGGIERQLLLTIDEETTDGIDRGYDAKLNETQFDDAYWMIDQKAHVIQAVADMAETRTLPLGVKLREAGLATFDIDALENVADEVNIFLRDHLTDSYYDLRASSITLDLPAGNYDDRFELVFANGNQVLSNENVDLENIQVDYLTNLKGIKIANNTTTLITGATLHNIVGQRTMNWEQVDNDVILDISHLSTGSYIFRLHTDKGTIAKKLIVN